MMMMMKSYIHLSNLLFILLCVYGAGSDEIMKKCDICKDIVTKFKKTLQSTAKSNFGGGNTNWEENKLGSFAFSETRLVEITEQLCTDSSSSSKCHSIVEEHEDILEKWWFNVYRKNTNSVDDFEKWLCQESLKFCCPANHFGPECKPCEGGVSRVCKDNGNCNGGGTRSGTGKCKCHAGYRNELCDECKDNYYEESKNDTHTVCKACHISCKDTCWEAGPKGCDDCRAGYRKSEEDGCVDVDECKAEKLPCTIKQYCSNTDGSFVCMNCDNSCESCLGSGPESCVKCNKGFTMQNNTCIDIDECKLGIAKCTIKDTHCVNKPGGYVCNCATGYDLIGDDCISKDLLADQMGSGSGKLKKKKKKKSKALPQPPPYTFLKYVAALILFALTGIFLKGHVVGSTILCVTMGFFIYRLGSYFG